MDRFEILDISGDAGIRAFGRDLQELFVNAAAGMYSLITAPELVSSAEKIELTVHSDTIEGLLVAWLNELIFRFDAYGFIGRDITIIAVDKTHVTAAAAGEEFDPAKHEGKLLIKAATYHGLKIVRSNGRYEAEIIFDI